MFESAEQKKAILDLLDRLRAAVDQEDPRALQELMLDAATIMLRMIAKDVPGALPLVVYGDTNA